MQALSREKSKSTQWVISMSQEKKEVNITPEKIDLLYNIENELPQGGTVNIWPGYYKISNPIVIPSNTSLTGTAPGVRIELADNSNCHMITNSDYVEGNTNITVSNVECFGERKHQSRPPDHKALTYACGIYFKRCQNISVVNTRLFEIAQNAIHLNNSDQILLKKIHTENLGWSGLGTSGASSIRLEEFDVYSAGLETIHSGIHLDGGVGIYINARVYDCTGNGIMLDSTYAELYHCEVEATSKRNFRGLSLSGSGERKLGSVLVKGTFSENAKAGVMVSNAESVYFDDAVIKANGEHGILFQGRNGGNHSLIGRNCLVNDNPVNIEELHASNNNWCNNFDLRDDTKNQQETSVSKMRSKTIAKFYQANPKVRSSVHPS